MLDEHLAAAQLEGRPVRDGMGLPEDSVLVMTSQRTRTLVCLVRRVVG